MFKTIFTKTRPQCVKTAQNLKKKSHLDTSLPTHAHTANTHAVFIEQTVEPFNNDVIRGKALSLTS